MKPPLATEGKLVKPVTFDKPEMFRWSGRDLHDSLSDTYDHLNHPAGVTDDSDPAGFILRTAMDAQVASDRVRKAVGHKSETSFPSNGSARQLKMVAAMIRAELPTRVYYVAMGGFDTHANQVGQHERLLGEFAQAMSAFYDELKATGHRQRVVSIAFSEFGRRVKQNASGGTDHGTAGPMFVFGEQVNPGLIGKHPSLTDLDDGDLKHKIDFRSVYANVLDNWMKIDSTAVLGDRFDHAKALAFDTPARFWSCESVTATETITQSTQPGPVNAAAVLAPNRPNATRRDQGRALRREGRVLQRDSSCSPPRARATTALFLEPGAARQRP
ncbi:MAG: DUF1501 domain-containing protein [Phycisphaerales bacterium]